MSFLSTGRETGYYSAAFKIVEVLTTVPWLLAASGLPILARAARDDSARLSYAVQRLFEVGLILGMWMSASTIVGAKLGIDVVAGAEFHPAIGVLEIQALAIVTSFVAAILGYALLSHAEYRRLLRANALAVLLVTVLSFVLIPADGAQRGSDRPDSRRGVSGTCLCGESRRSDAHCACRSKRSRGLRIGLGVSLGVAYALPCFLRAHPAPCARHGVFPAAVHVQGDTHRGVGALVRRGRDGPRVPILRRRSRRDARCPLKPRLQPGGWERSGGGRNGQLGSLARATM